MIVIRQLFGACAKEIHRLFLWAACPGETSDNAKLRK
jgi:hypothetical protein